MPRTRRLPHNKEITYSVAKEQELNTLHQLGYYEQQVQFFAHLHGRQDWMRAVVAHHLGLRSSTACHVAAEEDWLYGSFNVCIPVTIDDWNGKRVLIRLPLPYRVGEAVMPGNADEKIRCEAGTYVWLQENCPSIPIPRLYGFALSTGETFTRLENLPILSRYYQLLRRQISRWMGYPVPSNNIRHQIAKNITFDRAAGAGYLLMEFIEETQGTMLSSTWLHKQDDAKLRTNFFRGLARIFLDASRVPLPRIGSFIIDNDGVLRLANRPLSMEIHQLENENIPTDIPRDCTYSTANSYILDMLSVHDSRFRHQPNAVNDLGDCGYQLACLSAMRTIVPSLFQRDFRHRFSFVLTDLHQSNIFVDADWNITCLVNLEWGCSMPMEMISPPYWLTNKGVDQIDSAVYDTIRTEFMDILAAEERKLWPTPTSPSMAGNSEVMPRLSDVMNRTWETGTFWYTLALSSPSGLFSIFSNHIRPLFCAEKYGEEFNLVMAFLWGKDIGYIAGVKLSDKKEYDENLRQAFEDS